MLDINLTLLVQMAHFAIAYLIFRYVLLSKAFELILQRDKYMAKLGENVQTHELELANRQSYVAHACERMKQGAQEKIPAPIKKMLVQVPIDEIKTHCFAQKPVVDPQDATVIEVSDWLMQRIEHV